MSTELLDIPDADGLDIQLCPCGCGKVRVFLLDGDQNPFACFSIANDLWIPFAEDCVRASKGETKHGPPGAFH